MLCAVCKGGSGMLTQTKAPSISGNLRRPGTPSRALCVTCARMHTHMHAHAVPCTHACTRMHTRMYAHTRTHSRVQTKKVLSRARILSLSPSLPPSLTRTHAPTHRPDAMLLLAPALAATGFFGWFWPKVSLPDTLFDGKRAVFFFRTMFACCCDIIRYPYNLPPSLPAPPSSLPPPPRDVLTCCLACVRSPARQIRAGPSRN